MVGNIRAVWILLVCLQCSHLVSSRRTTGKIKTEVVELQEGTKSTVLNCSTMINGTKATIYWKKDGETIPIGGQFDNLPIYYAQCAHRGNYTCFTYRGNSLVNLKQFVVQVSAKPSRNKSVCGTPGERLWQETMFCDTPTIYDDYQCCNYHIPPPGKLQLRSKISRKFKNKCNILTISDPWEIDVMWSLSDNASWIWGWEVSRVGLDFYNLNVQSCVRINSRNKLNWTFDKIPFGAIFEIKVQALPSNNRNFLVKEVVIPTKIDICGEIGFKCGWEICLPVEVVKQVPRTSVLTWRPSNITVHNFEIYYGSNNETCNDSGSKTVENATHLVLNITKCRSYLVQVRPIFPNDEKGTFSKPIVFYPPQDPPSPPPTTASHTYVIVSCSAGIALLIVFLVIIFIKGKPIPRPDNPPYVRPNEAASSEVLIVHDNHCRRCNNVVHILANSLDKIGHIKCIVDFCFTNEITERGMRWYEDKLKSCDKVIVVCTKEGKKLWDEKERGKDGAYVFVLNMLCATNHNERNFSIVPLYFDISSREDIPMFLSGHACYSLPSSMQDLCSALHHHVYSESNIENFCNDMTPYIRRLKNAVASVRQNHKGYTTLKNTMVCNENTLV